MLLREHGGGGEHRYLFAGHYGLECRANGHLGFAETDVTTNEAVHRARLFHVDLAVDDRF